MCCSLEIMTCHACRLQYYVTLNIDCVFFQICRHKFSLINNKVPDTFVKNGEAYDFLGSANLSEFAPNGSYIKYSNLPS